VLTAIYATWTAILRGSRVGLEAAAQAQRERMAIRTIEEALTCSRSYLADLQHYGFFSENGSDAILSFVAQLPKSFPRSGRFGDLDVRRVSFALEGANEGQRALVMRQSPILMEFDEDEQNHPLVLAKNVKDIAFEFWEPRINDWTDAWTQTNQLPKMVKITLRMTPITTQRSAYISTPPVDEITRIVALPSAAVPALLQRANAPGQPPPPPPPP
jgi:hypothetical protein